MHAGRISWLSVRFITYGAFMEWSKNGYRKAASAEGFSIARTFGTRIMFHMYK